MAEDRQHNNGLVVSTVGGRQAALLRMRKYWKPVLGVIAVLVLVGGGWYWWQGREKPKDIDINAAPKATVNLLRQGNLNPADLAVQDRLEAAVNNTTNQKDKATLYDALATNAEARKDYPAMVQNLIQAYESGMRDSTALIAIAKTYEEQLGDVNNALKYYRLALTQAQEEEKQGSPYADGQLKYIQESIARMEAKGAR